MSKVVLYAHGGSGNHGCEAIVRATKKLLNEQELVLISSQPDEDRRYGIDELCTVVQDRDLRLNRFSVDFYTAYAALKLKKDFIPLEKLYYKRAFSNIRPGDIAMSIGGDNYCYADVYKYTMFHEMAKHRGAKTVLWGCSVEPEIVQRPEIAKDLANYDLITARETISYEALKQVNPNTVLVSDPAFCLDTISLPLPDGFTEGNTVGINISPMIMKNESTPGITMENYRELIRYILNQTDMSIALIPHVVWQDNDDRIPLRALYDDFAESGRVVMIEDHTCEELKGYLARCRFFVGARTHATIAAYSSGVPTLVVGYSVKARGLAKDLFGQDDKYVLPVQRLRDSSDLIHAFAWMQGHEGEINKHLKSILPDYLKRSIAGAEHIK
ncbi:MAG: polysaccharide pyruvyl transferase family protein [Faecousia sp.]